MDPFLAAARHIVKQSVDDFRRSIDGLDGDALNWKPAGDATNSMAVLTVHAWTSTRSWLSVAMGAPLPDRDRDSEFLASATDGAALRAWLDDFSAQCAALVDATATLDGAAIRKTHARPNYAPEEVPAAFALLHAVEHLREHEGQLSLTRQLWDARQRQ